MRGLTRFARSTTGLKVLAAVSGGFVTAWLCLHLAGNMTLFSDDRAADSYARALRDLGPTLWIVRAVLLVAIGVHVATTVRLWRVARLARPIARSGRSRCSATLASRTLRLGGLLLLLFIVFHVLHLSFGAGVSGFASGEVHDNVVHGLSSPPAVVAYSIASAIVGLHLFHGLWSMPRTLGLSIQRAGRLRRPAIAALSVLVAVGFAAVPVAVYLGIIR